LFLERALDISRPRSATCLSENSRLRLSALAPALATRRYGSPTPWNSLTSPWQLIAGWALFARHRWWTWDRLELSRRAIRVVEVPQVHSFDRGDARFDVCQHAAGR